MWNNALLLTLFALDLVVAVTAIAGGMAILAGLERDNFPSWWLEGTPFRSYTVPALLLTFVVGGSAAATTLGMPFSQNAGSILSVFAGLVLTGWVLGEISLLNTPRVSRTEMFYLGLGALLIVLGITAVLG